jgi:hypothetical protein
MRISGGSVVGTDVPSRRAAQARPISPHRTGGPEMISTLTPALAAEHRADLHAAAAQHRLARLARARSGVRATWTGRFRPAARRPRLALG